MYVYVVCDAARMCDVSSTGTAEDALKLGGILRSVTAVSVYAHPSVIHASGWLQAPAARADNIGSDANRWDGAASQMLSRWWSLLWCRSLSHQPHGQRLRVVSIGFRTQVLVKRPR